MSSSLPSSLFPHSLGCVFHGPPVDTVSIFERSRLSESLVHGSPVRRVGHTARAPWRARPRSHPLPPRGSLERRLRRPRHFFSEMSPRSVCPSRRRRRRRGTASWRRHRCRRRGWLHVVTLEKRGRHEMRRNGRLIIQQVFHLLFRHVAHRVVGDALFFTHELPHVESKGLN